jgi:hypothetical protein
MAAGGAAIAFNSHNTKPHGLTFHVVMRDGHPALRFERMLTL